nr:hypothetical protein [Tanacetum cinerariifolium]
MDNSKRGSISMQVDLHLRKSQCATTSAEMKRMQNVPYLSAVGSIMYAVRDDTKSQTVHVFILNGGAVVSKSSRQSNTAQHATKAEYIAASEAAKEVVWIRKFIDELDVVPLNDYPMKMNCDNSVKEKLKEIRVKQDIKNKKAKSGSTTTPKNENYDVAVMKNLENMNSDKGESSSKKKKSRKGSVKDPVGEGGFEASICQLYVRTTEGKEGSGKKNEEKIESVRFSTQKTRREVEHEAFQFFSSKFKDKNVTWVNQTKESGLQYDIILEANDKSCEYINVKTTSVADKKGFYISQIELSFASEMGASFIFARVELSDGELVRITTYRKPVQLLWSKKMNLVLLPC